MNLPYVSVCCVTYNHEDYITQCLDGFVMQKTNFAFEILVHDDASTDKTAEIVKEYETKYPDLFRCVYQTENQFLKQNTLVNILFKMAKGKYIALCEGDDYWIDPYKLQKQVDFLEANEDFSICFHPVKLWTEETQSLSDDCITSNVPEATAILDLARGNYIPTPSVVFRKNTDVILEFISLGALSVGDYVLHMLNAKYGKIKKLKDSMAVYRIHNGGIHSGKSNVRKVVEWIFLLDKISICFNKEVCEVFNLDIKEYLEMSFSDVSQLSDAEKEMLLNIMVRVDKDYVFQIIDKIKLLEVENRAYLRDIQSLKRTVKRVWNLFLNRVKLI